MKSSGDKSSLFVNIVNISMRSPLLLLGLSLYNISIFYTPLIIILALLCILCKVYFIEFLMLDFIVI